MVDKKIKIPKNTEIVIRSNMRNEGYLYVSRNMDTVIDLAEAGDEEFIEYAELRQLYSRNRSVLEDLMITIADVESDEITSSDVVHGLRLTKNYDEFSEMTGLDPYDFSLDDLAEVADEMEIEKYQKAIEVGSATRNLLIEESVYQHRQGDFRDFNKMGAVAKAINLEENESAIFWEDIRISAE